MRSFYTDESDESREVEELKKLISLGAPSYRGGMQDEVGAAPRTTDDYMSAHLRSYRANSKNGNVKAWEMKVGRCAVVRASLAFRGSCFMNRVSRGGETEARRSASEASLELRNELPESVGRTVHCPPSCIVYGVVHGVVQVEEATDSKPRTVSTESYMMHHVKEVQAMTPPLRSRAQASPNDPDSSVPSPSLMGVDSYMSQHAAKVSFSSDQVVRCGTAK